MMDQCPGLYSRMLKWSNQWSILQGATNATVGGAMQISVTEAKGQLTELVRRAEAGDEVILTRHGQAAVRLVPLKAPGGRAARRDLLKAVRAAAVGKAVIGPDAARSQDFLYGDEGLPE